MPHPVLVKICTNTSIADARMAAQEGADYLGVIVDHPPSPRNVSLPLATDIVAAVDKPVVAVTVNQTLDQLLCIYEALQPAALQLHGDETPELVRQLKSRGIIVWAVVAGESEAMLRRAQAMVDAGADAVLSDARTTSAKGVTYGGTGQTSDWKVARQLVEMGIPLVLAGGLTPENVATAIETVQPWMVDVGSGVEARKGVKDHEKVRQFIAAARAAQPRQEN